MMSTHVFKVLESWKIEMQMINSLVNILCSSNSYWYSDISLKSNNKIELREDVR